MDLSPVFSLLQKAEPSHLQIIMAEKLNSVHALPWAPDKQTLLVGSISPNLFSVIAKIYPNDHICFIASSGSVINVQLSTIPNQTTGVLLPPIARKPSLESFTEIMAHLRDPETGCPWDKEQTFSSLRKHIQEEAYEVMDALDSNDPHNINEELGDLLMLIVMTAQIGVESGDFNVYTVLNGITEKMLRRHPHIFGDVKIDNVDDVLINWQKIKADERKQKGQTEKGVLDGLPRSMPALSQALEMQARAAKVGFDWPQIDGVLDKVVEELNEIRNAQNHPELVSEIGDLLFVLVNFARWNKVEPEVALQLTNNKFRNRFGYIEKQLRERQLVWDDVDLSQMDAWWNEAKRI